MSAPFVAPSPADRAAVDAFCRRRLEGGASWLLGGEAGVSPAREWARSRIRALVVRLSTYRDTADSMTHPLLGQLARGVEGVFVDHAYLPPPRDYAAMLEAGIPPLFGTTTKRPALEFDVVALSNSIAQELLNLPLLLRASGVPLRRGDRLADPACPFVVLGGANASATSVLHGAEPGASLVDAVVVGEGEVAWPAMLACLARAREAGLPKEEVVRLWRAEVPGYYEPDRYRQRFVDGRFAGVEKADPDAPLPVRKAMVPSLAGVRTLEEGFVPFDPEAAGVASVEIDRGCPANCSFCREGWEIKPYRERGVPDLLASIRVAKANQGLHTVNLFSLNFNMHAGFHALVPAAAGVVGRVAMKSQRFDILAHDPAMAEVEAAAGKTSVTCGLEGISDRLRAFLQKTLPADDVVEACRRLGRTGSLRELKLFVIATGFEEEADFAEFEGLLDRILPALGGARAHGGARVLVNVTPLVAMPNTPSQYLPSRSIPPERDPVVRRIAGASRRRGFEFRCAVSEGENEVSAYLLRGDRRVQAALLASSLEDRFVYYGRIPNGVARRFRERIAAAGADPAAFTGAASPGDPLPWEEIHTGVAPAFVVRTALASEAFRDLDYCLDRPGTRGHCTRCDACVEPAQIRAIVRRTIAPPPPTGWERGSLARRKGAPLRVRVKVDPLAAFAPRASIAATLARALMRGNPSLVETFVRPLGCVPEDGAIHGRVLVDLLFAPGASPEEAEAVLARDGTGVDWVEFERVEEEAAPVRTLRLRGRGGPSTAAAVRERLRRDRVKHEERRRDGGRLFVAHAGSGKARDLESVEVGEDGTVEIAVSTRFPWQEFFRSVGVEAPPECLGVAFEASAALAASDARA